MNMNCVKAHNGTDQVSSTPQAIWSPSRVQGGSPAHLSTLWRQEGRALPLEMQAGIQLSPGWCQSVHRLHGERGQVTGRGLKAFPMAQSYSLQGTQIRSLKSTHNARVLGDSASKKVPGQCSDVLFLAYHGQKRISLSYSSCLPHFIASVPLSSD